MRHVRSIFYALVLAPAGWVLTGVGLNRDLFTRGRDGFAVETFAGLLLLLLAGASYGILALGPFSPAGPFLAGLAHLGVAVWALVAPAAYAAVWPPEMAKDGFDLSRPGYGLAALLSVPLICTALSARRWAKYEPPVLPLIGQIGRARGAAAVPGTPIAVVQTAEIAAPPAFGSNDLTTVLRLTDDTTTVVVSADDEATVVTARGEIDKLVDLLGGEATLAVPPPAHERTTTVVLSPDEEATVTVLSHGEASTRPAEEATDAFAPPVAESTDETEKTAPVPAGEVVAAAKDDDEEATELVAAVVSSGDANTGRPDGSTEPAEAAEDTTEVFAGVAADAATDSSGGVDDGAQAGPGGGAEDGDAAARADGEADVAPPPAAAEVDAVEHDEVAGSPAGDPDDEPTEPLVAAGVDREAEDETTVSAPVPSGGEVIRLPVGAGRPTPDAGDDAAADVDEKTQVVRLPVGDAAERTEVVRFPIFDTDEKTQVVRLPVRGAAERADVVRLPVGDAADRTEVVRLPVRDSADQVGVLRLPPGDAADRTEVVRLPVGDAAKATGAQAAEADETTRVLQFPQPVAKDGTMRVIGPGQRGRDLPHRSTKDVGGDETQVIWLAGSPAVDDERPRLIRPGLVTPPGERTEVLRFPTLVPVDGARGQQQPASPVSIADAERPNFADDPTSRIVPPGSVADDETKRSMTVMKMERPPDEAGEETTQVEIPSQRRPPD